MNLKQVLVTARAFWVSGLAAREKLHAAGITIKESGQAGPLSPDVLIQELHDCDAVIASSDPYTEEIFAACPYLQIVSRCGVGIDSVDIPAATQAGVVVTNTPGAMTEAVADYTFALMLSLCRGIVAGDNLMRSGGWGEIRGVLIAGKTLGLVGMGQIGQGVLRRARGFGMQVLAYDPILAASPNAANFPDVRFVDLDELLRLSDFVSVHAPNLPETRRMFSTAQFERMKPTAYFINTARGALVDEDALLQALETGQIAGAATDVYTMEPLPAAHPLRHAPNCVLTPHNAFNAVEAAEAMSLISAQNVLDLWSGKRPNGICNPAVFDSPKLRLKEQP
jgi:D-3-phosphoglycerate dehydrogenase / 2-oxoglutarate reductase